MRTLAKTVVVCIVIVIFSLFVYDRTLGRKPDKASIIMEDVESGYVVDETTGRIWHTVPVSEDVGCMPCHSEAVPEGKVDMTGLTCPYTEVKKKIFVDTDNKK